MGRWLTTLLFVGAATSAPGQDGTATFAATLPGAVGDVSRWQDPPRRVRISGWLMYDFQFETRRPDLTLPAFEQRESGWEVHPVTKIEIWNDARAAFVEVPR